MIPLQKKILVALLAMSLGGIAQACACAAGMGSMGKSAAHSCCMASPKPSSDKTDPCRQCRQSQLTDRLAPERDVAAPAAPVAIVIFTEPLNNSTLCVSHQSNPQGIPIALAPHDLVHMSCQLTV